ncbi:MAG: aspartyl protease family protein [Phenylobacterium sp.]
MRTVLAALAVAATAGSAHSQTPSATAASVLAANHAAVGRVPAKGAARLDYRHIASGLTGTLTDRVDLAMGAYVEDEEASGIRDANGFDGRTPWQTDISGASTDQMGGDRLPVAISAAYRYANLWWRPDRGGARIVYAARETEGGKAFDRLTVTPKGGKRFDAWFDAQSHLLAKVTYDQQFLHITERDSDYRREGGAMLAHKIVSDPGLGEGGLSTAILTHVSYGPTRPPGVYARPKAPPAGASIAGGAASTTVPFRLLNNHIYLQAKVNGKGPYTFIVDTGGHTLLSPHLIADVGLKAVGEAVSSGAGEGHSTTGFVHFDEIAIGDVRLKDEMGFATDIYDKSIEGIAVDGMVGFELIRRMVTTVDYGKQTITFTDPAKFRPGKALGVPVPFVFYDHLPNVRGSVLGLPARFDIDTGSRAEIDLTSPFVNAHDLRAKFAKGASAVTGWGVGGPARDYMVRLASLKLGPVEVTDIAAGLSEAKGGSIADPNYEGNIGSALLKRFVVTFDYAHQVMYLQRIAPTPPDVGTFDRSGLWINAKNGGYEVTDVAKGSAGAEAGVAVGDVITAIDGKPAVAEELYAARRRLRDEAVGTKVALAVRHGGETREVVLVLRDQI